MSSLDPEYTFRPQPAIESRRNTIRPTDYEYNAEVMFNGKNYILPDNPYATRAEASAAADAYASAMIADMLKAGMVHVAKLKIAKE